MVGVSHLFTLASFIPLLASVTKHCCCEASNTIVKWDGNLAIRKTQLLLSNCTDFFGVCKLLQVAGATNLLSSKFNLPAMCFQTITV